MTGAHLKQTPPNDGKQLAGAKHHAITPVSMAACPTRLHGPDRPELPVAVAYQMKPTKRVQKVQALATIKSESKHSELFFKGQAKNLEKDPFLQRLSRLN